MIPIRFAAPAALVLLILLPAAFMLTRRRILPRGILAFRILALGLIILALAQPQLPLGRPNRTVMFVVDLSDSIPSDARAVAGEFVRSAARTRQLGDRVGLITFGSEAVVEEMPTLDPQLHFSSHPPGESTDIARAIRTALAAMPPDGERRIVLATDGNANRGDLSAALALARSEGVTIDVVAIGPHGEAEVLVDEVRAPPEVRVGERFSVHVVIEATVPAAVQLNVQEDGIVIDRRSMSVPAGRTIVTINRLAKREGMLRYTASILFPPARTTANKRAAALVWVRGAPGVWYVARQEGPLARALAAQGWRVKHLVPEALPTTAIAYEGTAAVVLDDVSATTLAPAQMSALRDYVGRLGGGLLAAGGVHSFGVGGYLGTPLEEVLPVAMDIRHRLAIPSMAIILVIDASGSMGSFGQEIAPLELAKETGATVIDLLGERDIIGAIAFDQTPRWLVPPTQARNREAVLSQISRLQSGGGTNMHPAIALAYEYLRQSPAKVRHAIVLSDGQTDPGDFRGLLMQMARSKVTVSTVAIGGDADVDLMRNVATWGGGRAYIAKDLYTIPQIFTAEALLASRVYVV
jgi:Mg-chelatase subunit ChlD